MISTTFVLRTSGQFSLKVMPMVADMLILLGGGAAVIAIALVVIWLAIWLFIRMVIGWVRLLVRLGKRWCRKEIAA